MSTKKWVYKQILLRLSKPEAERLLAYSQKRQVNVNDVLRELVRNLPD